MNNGSTDEIAAVTRKFIGNASFRTIYMFEPKLGKSNGVNTALEKANDQIVAFTDDDCYPEPDFVSQVWSAFEDSSVGYISGRVILHDPADHPTTINESDEPFTFPAGSLVRAAAIPGANMAFKRRVLLDITGFDPRFGPGSSFEAAEDVEATSRASALGWKGQYTDV